MRTVTIKEIIERVNKERTNTIDDSLKIGWLSEIDEQIYDEIVLTHINADKYEREYPYESDTASLIAPRRFADVYIFYLESKIDYFMNETERYINDVEMFSSSYQSFADWYNRNNLPLQKNTLSTGGNKRCCQKAFRM